MYLRAFWDLASERRSDGMSVGRIPWSMARLYARDELGLEECMLDHFWRIISAMDAGFLNWQKSEHDRHVRAHAPKKRASKGGNRQTYDR